MKTTVELKHPQYFEGILQLRNPNNEIINFIIETIKKDNKALITKEKKMPNGIDFYITSQRYIQALGKKIKSTFPGMLKISAKLFTRSRTGKDLYRVNLLFNYIKLKKNQIIKFKGEEYVVLGWGKKVFIKNIESGKKREVSFDEIKKKQDL